MALKFGSALEALKKVRSFAEDEDAKLTKRIHDEVEPLLIDTFKGAHAAVDGLHAGINDITDFCEDLKKAGGNGGDPLPKSGEQSGTVVPPRSSEVAQK